MRRRVLLAVGVVGLVVAIALGGFLTVRRVPRLVGLTPLTGVITIAGSTPRIEVRSRGGVRTLDWGWCAGVSQPVKAGEGVTAWTDTDPLGRTRVWRVQGETRPICRFTESAAAVTSSNRTLRVAALISAAIGLLGFAGLLLESWRVLPRG